MALQLIQTLAVVIGVAFGLAQLRQLSHQREVQAGLQLLAPLQTPDSAETMLLIHGLPENLTGAELRQRLGEKFRGTLATLALFESLGPIVARGHVPIEMYAEFYRGPTLLCWRKFRRYIEEERQGGWPMLFEWLQWLAERMEALPQGGNDIPAHQRFSSWKSSKDYPRLSIPRQ
ncbi:hypothetical protein G7076_02595 [Sphingomonas sp. HDW15A]|uniref:DUF4760 domain-containing protein n=1 Tax=Sphingomonas sp. HDW15A TaxID=2714942 RepID=UPI0014086FA8|nr:hypothetical protein [Sphingomonas sp. HDW15A]QIK95515.1 hypothetical protein G7076_02595 [Sphingomonas sp. HDW15A]